MANASNLQFIKMHGLGNDFVVLDGRQEPINLATEDVRAIADRRTGIGCDQLITLKNSNKADVFMYIQNADGSTAEACGNATRCIGALIMAETQGKTASIETDVDLLHCQSENDGVRANMGKPRFNWADIPLAEERDTLHVDLNVGALKDPVAVNVGNPHVVYFVPEVDKVDLASLGPMVETYPLFPERVNVNVVEIISPNEIKLRVWERGAGITRACGTGAAASVVAGVRRGLLERKTKVQLLGGTLDVHWDEDDNVYISGAAETSYHGELNMDELLRARTKNG
ncbi:MAG: diaminopimelate epimerase [Sphingomonadales bacterium]|nr:diaminopimelate epimerase [Sphingomonadales bacterium]